jgi:probable HAF family extracellular repeat protein
MPSGVCRGTICLALAGVLGVLLPGPARALYQVTDLGTLGGNHTRAAALNRRADAVGVSGIVPAGQRAFLRSLGGEMSSLGALGGGYSEAHGLNDVRRVVGEAETEEDQVHAFLWTPSGGMIDLGILGGGSYVGFSSEAWDVNAGGQVVGMSTASPNRRTAFVWSVATGMADLGLSQRNSHAYAINDAGQIVGFYETPVGYTHAFLWSETGGLVDLGTLGGDYSFAEDVNAGGQVVGRSGIVLGPGPYHAFLWSAQTGMADLGTLAAGGFSDARAISDRGEIVGWASVAGLAHHAFVWDVQSGMRDLNGLIPAGSGWILEAATDVNECGRIVGDGLLGGLQRAFLLTPEQDPCRLDLCLPFYSCNPFVPTCRIDWYCYAAWTGLASILAWLAHRHFRAA